MESHVAIVEDSLCRAKSIGYGGLHRSQQLEELVHHAGFSTCSVDYTLQVTRGSRYLNGLRLLSKYPNGFPFRLRKLMRSDILMWGERYEQYLCAMMQHCGPKLLLWEATVFHHHVAPYVARELGFRCVAAPQNLESFVPNPSEDNLRVSAWSRFAEEVRSLGKANRVFAITREEQWVLTSAGIRADYLPYYPPRKLFDNLLQVRERRTNSRKRRLILLGAAGYEPTRRGMVEQMRWLAKSDALNRVILDVVGIKTELLAKEAGSELFVIHGGVPFEQLADLLVEAQAVLLHQVAGAGSLTRIPEMLVAGIPVIGNGNACRDAFRYSGVHSYETEAELAELVSREFTTPPVPPRPEQAEERFIECVRSLASQTS